MRGKVFQSIIACVLTLIFMITSAISPQFVQASTLNQLPVPGTMLNVSSAYTPVLMKGMTVNLQNPFQFDFIVHPGDSALEGDAFKDEAQKLVRYFLAALTTPEDQLWVNLSPYEKNRIIPQHLGTTEMGYEMLAQDYILKQLTASLMYPEGEVGKKFWEQVYAKAAEQGITDVPMDTFNKVWIVPNRISVYEHHNHAFIVENSLKVMLESDYLARENSVIARSEGDEASLSELSSPNVSIGDPNAKQNGFPTKTFGNDSFVMKDILRSVIIPVIEKEVNEGKNFAPLRQIYNGMLLAAWYKKRLKESVLGQVYADKNKVAGIDTVASSQTEAVWNRYVEAFQKGAYNYIGEDYDPKTSQVVSKKYFSGGVVGPKSGLVAQAMLVESGREDLMKANLGSSSLTVNLANAAMLGSSDHKLLKKKRYGIFLSKRGDPDFQQFFSNENWKILTEKYPHRTAESYVAIDGRGSQIRAVFIPRTQITLIADWNGSKVDVIAVEGEMFNSFRGVDYERAQEQFLRMKSETPLSLPNRFGNAIYLERIGSASRGVTKISKGGRQVPLGNLVRNPNTHIHHLPYRLAMRLAKEGQYYEMPNKNTVAAHQVAQWNDRAMLEKFDKEEWDRVSENNDTLVASKKKGLWIIKAVIFEGYTYVAIFNNESFSEGKKFLGDYLEEVGHKSYFQAQSALMGNFGVNERKLPDLNIEIPAVASMGKAGRFSWLISFLSLFQKKSVDLVAAGSSNSLPGPKGEFFSITYPNPDKPSFITVTHTDDQGLTQRLLYAVNTAKIPNASKIRPGQSYLKTKKQVSFVINHLTKKRNPQIDRDDAIERFLVKKDASGRDILAYSRWSDDGHHKMVVTRRWHEGDTLCRLITLYVGDDGLVSEVLDMGFSVSTASEERDLIQAVEGQSLADIWRWINKEVQKLNRVAYLGYPFNMDTAFSRWRSEIIDSLESNEINFDLGDTLVKRFLDENYKNQGIFSMSGWSQDGRHILAVMDDGRRNSSFVFMYRDMEDDVWEVASIPFKRKGSFPNIQGMDYNQALETLGYIREYFLFLPTNNAMLMAFSKDRWDEVSANNKTLVASKSSEGHLVVKAVVFEDDTYIAGFDETGELLGSNIFLGVDWTENIGDKDYEFASQWLNCLASHSLVTHGDLPQIVINFLEATKTTEITLFKDMDGSYVKTFAGNVLQQIGSALRERTFETAQDIYSNPEKYFLQEIGRERYDRRDGANDVFHREEYFPDGKKLVAMYLPTIGSVLQEFRRNGSLISEKFFAENIFRRDGEITNYWYIYFLDKQRQNGLTEIAPDQFWNRDRLMEARVPVQVIDFQRWLSDRYSGVRNSQESVQSMTMTQPEKYDGKRLLSNEETRTVYAFYWKGDTYLFAERTVKDDILGDAVCVVRGMDLRDWIRGKPYEEAKEFLLNLHSVADPAMMTMAEWEDLKNKYRSAKTLEKREIIPYMGLVAKWFEIVVVPPGDTNADGRNIAVEIWEQRTRNGNKPYIMARFDYSNNEQDLERARQLSYENVSLELENSARMMSIAKGVPLEYYSWPNDQGERFVAVVFWRDLQKSEANLYQEKATGERSESLSLSIDPSAHIKEFFKAAKRFFDITRWLAQQESKFGLYQIFPRNNVMQFNQENNRNVKRWLGYHQSQLENLRAMATSIKTKATFLMGQNNANSQVYVHIVPSQQTIAIRAGVGNVAYVAFPFAGMEDEQIQQSFSEASVYFIGQDGGRSLFQNKADTTNIVIEVRQNKAMLTDVDLAIQADPVESRVDNGGMDFNAIGKDMQIQMNSDGFVFPKIDPAMLDQFQTEGFEIRAIQIRPLGMPVLRQMIGLAPEEKESDSSSESKPMELSYVKEN